MNFDYSTYSGRILSSQPNTAINELGSSYYGRFPRYEPEIIPYNRPLSPVIYKTEHSPYFLEFENDELAHSLYHEKRANQELVEILDNNKYELNNITRRYDSKVDEYNSLALKYEQSEQIRLEQARLITSLQKELETLREKMKNLGGDDEFGNNVQEREEETTAKIGGKTTTGFNKKANSLINNEEKGKESTRSTSKNPFANNLSTSTIKGSSLQKKPNSSSNVSKIKPSSTSTTTQLNSKTQTQQKIGETRKTNPSKGKGTSTAMALSLAKNKSMKVPGKGGKK